MAAPDDPPRLLRGCDICRQVDDHPRHVLGVPPDWPGAVPDAGALAAMITAAQAAGIGDDPAAMAFMVGEQLDPLTVVRHLDCCAANGCYDGSCAAQLARHGGKTREPLVTALEAETAKLGDPKHRDAILAELPRQGLTAEQEQALRDAQIAGHRAALAELEG